MNYQKQLQKVIDFIGQHLDEEISLEQLSHISCLSKFHFHRLFTAFTGVSLQQYIKWLRLKRAAHQLIVDKNNQLSILQSMRALNLMKRFRALLKKRVE